MKGIRWTEKEIAILIGLKKRGLSLKNNMHLLPGRSYGAAEFKSRGTPMNIMPSARRIQAVMQDGKERTAREIGDIVGIDRKSVNEYMRVATAPGAGQWAHVARVVGMYKKSVYVYGPGENADREAAPSPDSEEMSDADMDAMHRSSVAWWPSADPVLVSAMSAMVAAGGISA